MAFQRNWELNSLQTVVNDAEPIQPQVYLMPKPPAYQQQRLNYDAKGDVRPNLVSRCVEYVRPSPSPTIDPTTGQMHWGRPVLLKLPAA